MKRFLALLVAAVAVLTLIDSASAVAVFPTNHEQYMIELVNLERMDPVGVPARWGGMDLNEGLAPGTISDTPKQPLALSTIITAAAQFHSQWQLDNDTFAHTGVGTPAIRMALVGYGALGTYGSAENIGWQGELPGTPDLTQYTEDLHAGLFQDFSVPGRGHRLNIMNEDLKEIGIGLREGQFDNGQHNFNAVMVTQDFAYKFDDPFITGVAYRDNDSNSFYSPDGEGIQTIVAARRQSDLKWFWTVTVPSGGYALRVPDGTYDILAFGGTLTTPQYVPGVTVSGLNEKVDFVEAPAAATLADAAFLSEAQALVPPGALQVVPEPASLALLSMGALLVLRRRR